MFTRGDGFVLLLVFLVFVYYLISLMRNKTEEEVEDNLMKLPKAILFTIIGIVGIVFGSNFVDDCRCNDDNRDNNENTNHAGSHIAEVAYKVHRFKGNIAEH